MTLALRQFSMICLALLLVAGRGVVAQMPLETGAAHQCDHRADSPQPADDCDDNCPICQISVEDLALLPPAPKSVTLARPPAQVDAGVNAPRSWPAECDGHGRRARGPPAAA